MAFVDFLGVSKRFGSVDAVARTDLAIERGEFFSLLGPSGCGKSTTLRMLAGFLAPSTGHIHVNGRDITRLPPEARGIGIVFQNYAIFPHMNVFDNIAFGLVERGEDRDSIRKKVETALAQVDLQGYGERFERELSGGQKQRVALARVLVIEPEILLLDEPLSALDKRMREEMKYWIKDIQASIGITTIYVTHDQSEALTMSDRIGVMNNGHLLQIGTPDEIYEAPNSRFIAEFIGDSNLLEVKITEVGEQGCVVDLGINAPGVPARLAPTVAVRAGDTAALLLRPEMLRLSPEPADETPRLHGEIIDEVYQGSFRRYRLRAGHHELSVEVPNRPEIARLQTGASVDVYWGTDSAVVVP